MKKSIITKLLMGVMCAALCLAVPMVSQAAERGEPVDKVIASDGKTHAVTTFGTALVVMLNDGSIEIYPIGGLSGVDIMIDGVIYKNIRHLTISSGQQVKMSLDKGNVLVKGATAETAASVKTQIDTAFAAGAKTVNIAELTGVTAYKVNDSGKMETASGTVAGAEAVGNAVQSVEQSYSSFAQEIEEIKQEEIEALIAANEARDKAAAAAAAVQTATVAAAPTQSTESSASGSSSISCTMQMAPDCLGSMPAGASIIETSGTLSYTADDCAAGKWVHQTLEDNGTTYNNYWCPECAASGL